MVKVSEFADVLLKGESSSSEVKKKLVDDLIDILGTHDEKKEHNKTFDTTQSNMSDQNEENYKPLGTNV